MKQSTIYSIGHGNKSIEKFINELEAHNIKFVVDVRTRPYSGRFPRFNKALLEKDLNAKGITYLFLGDKLGGLPEDKSCYVNGKVEYDLIKQKAFFREGLERLLTANEKQINVAMMCSESKPGECHRSKLIGQALLSEGISVKHIISEAKIKSQETVINEINKGVNMVDLFGNETSFTSRKSY
jgi:uncharacterized protein (DUF488 family)